MTADAYVKALPDRAAVLELYRRAAVSGLAPRILAQDRETVTFERVGVTLKQWWESTKDVSTKTEMKLHLRERIKQLHQSGICHRDLHSENVMVGDDHAIRFIDFDLAQWVDPNWRCYDLNGPSEQVGTPRPHASQAGHQNGVWWGPEISGRCLAHVLGQQPPD